MRYFLYRGLFSLAETVSLREVSMFPPLSEVRPMMKNSTSDELLLLQSLISGMLWVSRDFMARAPPPLTQWKLPMIWGSIMKDLMNSPQPN